MKEPTEKEINEYLDYLASHMIIISDYIKNSDVDNKSIISQYLDEIGESVKSILSIVNKEGEVYKNIDNSTIKIIRDFKIGKIMDGRNK
jgi:uncharacterized membrane protein